MSTVLVTKSKPAIIAPSEKPTPARNISLSSFDKSVAGVAITCLLVFEHATTTSDPVESIKRALPQALAYYQPIAGRLVVGVEAKNDAVSCAGEGVLFVAAKASCTLESSGLSSLFNDAPSPVPELAKDLAVCASARGWGCTDPLLLMQVTEFSCGGFVVGATWDHVIADGEGMAQFLRAVGEIARGVSPLSVVPVRCDEALIELPPSLVAAKQGAVSVDNPSFPSMEINIPSGLISRIKAEFSRRTAGQTCTVFEVVTAVLWQCRTRAVVDDPDVPILLVFAANLRKHLGVRDGYYGNCVVPQILVQKSGAVMSGSITDVVKIIKDAKEKIPDMFKNGGQQIDTGDASSFGTTTDQIGKLIGYHGFNVTSWRDIGFDVADFGSGRPARVVPHMAGPGLPLCIILPPCKGKDGANVSSLSVQKEHASAFANELARFI